MITREYVFTVTSTYPFPFDMLRYDRCWPSSSTDAGLIRARALRGGPEKITIRLRGKNKPEVARWNSFGWAVGPHDAREAA